MKYSVEEILEFIRKVYCMNDEAFMQMYKTVFGFANKFYVDEKFDLARKSVSKWMCGLDNETLEEMMNYCLNK